MTEQALPDVPSASEFYQGDAAEFKSLTGWQTGQHAAFHTDRNNNTYPYDVLNENGSRTLATVWKFPNPDSRDGTQTLIWFLRYRPEQLSAEVWANIPRSFNDIHLDDKESKAGWFLRTAIAGLEKTLGHPLRMNGDGGIDPAQFTGDLQADVNLRSRTDQQGRIRTEPNSFNPIAPAGTKAKTR